MTSSHPRRMPPGAPRGQRGVVLMVALIVLVGLTLAGLSMVRSVDTGIAVAGNLSFRQAAAQSLDAGVEAAIMNIPADLGLSNNATPKKYFPAMLADSDADEIPDFDLATGYKVDWKNDGFTIVDPGGVKGYTVRYIVERMCFGGSPIKDDLDATGRCNMEQKSPGFTSNKKGSTDLGEFRKIHYRITVKVEGPRNTETYAQAVISK